MTPLLASRRENIDYCFKIISRPSPIIILAPHGGKIEPHTSRIATAIAGLDFSPFLFEGIMPKGNFETLHVTSDHYDEPSCLKLVGSCEIVVAVHGLKRGTSVNVGGLDEALRDAIVAGLQQAGFQASIDTSLTHGGRSQGNICNKGLRHRGVQLEIPMAIRKELSANSTRLNAFSNAVRAAIASQ